MEILTTAEVEGKTLTLDQTFNLSEGKFITIKELFSIEGEIFISIISHQSPYTINLPGNKGTTQTGRFFLTGAVFVASYSRYL